MATKQDTLKQTARINLSYRDPKNRNVVLVNVSWKTAMAVVSLASTGLAAVLAWINH